MRSTWPGQNVIKNNAHPDSTYLQPSACGKMELYKRQYVKDAWTHHNMCIQENNAVYLFSIPNHHINYARTSQHKTT